MLFYFFLIIMSLFSIALHGSRPIVSLFADSQGASALIIGLLVSSYAFLPMLMAVRVGKWLDYYGARKTTLLGGSGMLLALLVPIFYSNLGTLFFSQSLIGFSQVCVLLSLQKTVGNLPGNRDKLIAAFSMTGSLGEMVGPLISGFSYEFFGFQVAFGISLFFIIIALCLVFFLKPSSWSNGSSVSKYKLDENGSTWLMLRQPNLRKALIISGLVLYSKDLFVAYFPVYGIKLGMAASSIGIILSIMAGMSILVRLIQFWLVQRFSRGRVLTMTLIISGVAFLVIPLNSTFVLLAGVAGLLGVGLGLGQPLSLVYALNLSPEGRQGELLGMRLTFNRGSQFVAPFIFGGIGSFAGLSPIFLVSGCILLFGAYFTRMSTSTEEIKMTSYEEKGF